MAREDLSALRMLMTPEELSYFSDELAQNASRGVVNQISDVKLLQGDLLEAWREGQDEYATVAMRYSLERQDGRSGEAIRVSSRTSHRRRESSGRSGGREAAPWLLSAIQQTT